MKKSILRLFAACLIVMLLLPMLGQGVHAQQKGNATILFTHDLHSHFLPSADRFGGTVGGYARLMTLIKAEREKNPDALLLDGGDFSMGSLFQTAFTTSALELRLMGAMGYDVTTFGNHEYDYLSSGLCSMLYAALESVNATVQSYKHMCMYLYYREEFPKNSSKKIKRMGLIEKILPEYEEKLKK